ncbi:1443_t:CDS:10, partial [Funneliformis caledonium]
MKCLQHKTLVHIPLLNMDLVFYYLRKAILEELPNAENVKAIQLTLWRVKVASSVFRNKDIDIDTYLNDELEDSSDTVGNAFQNVEGSNIRVVVGVPVTGFDNNSHEGYLHKNMLSALFKKVIGNPWLFLMGNSGTYGIYFSLNAGNGFRNLRSQDMNISITDLGKYLTANDPKKYTQFHKQRNFTLKNWLILQLLSRKLDGDDFWITISCQKQLLIAIDESQAIIINAGNLCLVLSETGMSFDDIKLHAASTIAKSGDATFRNFFSIYDGFYECNEMSKFIWRFLPLDNKLIKSTFNIFQDHQRFIVQFLEHALLDTSSMFQNDVNKNVEIWQRNAFNFIITTFIKSCFPNLRKKKEAWNKVLNIMILNLFSYHTKLVKGNGIAEIVQYEFAQLCSFKGLYDLNTFQMDVISVQIAELISILTFRDYMKKTPNEFKAKLLENLCSVHYNASCAVSCKTTIRNFDDKNLTILYLNGNMKKENPPDFFKNLTITFFMLKKVASPDLTKLIKGTPSVTTKDTTDLHHFYPYGEKRIETKKRLRKEVLDCLKSKYYKDSQPRRSVASNFNDPK